MMGRRHIAALSAFASWASLAAAVAIATVTPCVAAPTATPDEEETAATSSLEFNDEDGTLTIEWSGPIVPGMTDYLRTALDKYRAASHRVVLVLNSAGGQVEEGDRAIHILDELKPTRRLITVVLDGNLCASMCIPIFLQGDNRVAGRTSQWIFHKAAKPGANGKQRLEETLQLFDRYYAPAGVSPDWIKSIVPIIKRAELWQSGSDLIKANNGIVTYPLEKWTERLVAPSGNGAKFERTGRRRSHIANCCSMLRHG
jgi:ATP-dependent protease ClpP protease subunit